MNVYIPLAACTPTPTPPPTVRLLLSEIFLMLVIFPSILLLYLLGKLKEELF